MKVFDYIAKSLGFDDAKEFLNTDLNDVETESAEQSAWLEVCRGAKDRMKAWNHELALGEQEELEHTDNPRVARRIALDHLKEDPRYYTKLRACMKKPADDGEED